MRWKTSRITGRRLTAATADKYRNWLNRFERWIIANEIELDLGLLTEDDMRHLESDVLDEIDDRTLEESSAILREQPRPLHRQPNVVLPVLLLKRESRGAVVQPAIGHVGPGDRRDRLGAAIAAFGAGALRTWLGDYQVAFITAGLLCILACGLVMRIRRSQRTVAAPRVAAAA